jgi:hypothetical protein
MRLSFSCLFVNFFVQFFFDLLDETWNKTWLFDLKDCAPAYVVAFVGPENPILIRIRNKLKSRSRIRNTVISMFY